LGAKESLKKLDRLIESLQRLVQNSTDLRQESYRVRLSQAIAIRSRVKRSANRRKKPGGKSAAYHGNGFAAFVTGGAPGLKK
jgi:Tfp pilus assembly protein PilV